MKKKFILMTTVAVMLIAMVCASAVPVMTPEPTPASASETIALAEAADLVVMSSEALIINYSAPAPATMGATGEAPIWLSPEKIWGAEQLAGGPNKFI